MAMKIGFIGLGKMGTRMVEKLLSGGHEVVGWNRSKDVLAQYQLVLEEKHLANKFTGVHTLEALVQNLEESRIVWSMLPAGEATESIFQEVTKHLSPGDIFIDGGNSFYKDTQRRSEELRVKRILFLGIGVSGGIKASENGYPLMVGGDKEAYQTILPILDTLSKPSGGHEYFGKGGAGHFVKMIHNGIEYGQMQAIGEGFGVLEKSPYDLDLVKVAKNWQKGTIVSSFLIDCAKDALEKNAKLDDIEGVIDATGEALWTVEQGKKEGVPVENIEQSLEFRRRSQTDPAVASSFAARMVASLRREFGGHKVKEKK